MEKTNKTEVVREWFPWWTNMKLIYTGCRGLPRMSWPTEDVVIYPGCRGLPRMSWPTQDVVVYPGCHGVPRMSWRTQDVVVYTGCHGVPRMSWCTQDVVIYPGCRWIAAIKGACCWSLFTLCVCPQDRTKMAKTTITKLATGIVHHESWLPDNIMSTG